MCRKMGYKKYPSTIKDNSGWILIKIVILKKFFLHLIDEGDCLLPADYIYFISFLNFITRNWNLANRKIAS